MKSWLTCRYQSVVAPIVAVTMAGLLFVYARTFIQAAKRNAQRHREADGGQISWLNETQRRHGALERPEDQSTLKQLALGAKGNVKAASTEGEGRVEKEDAIRARKGKPPRGEE